VVQVKHKKGTRNPDPFPVWTIRKALGTCLGGGFYKQKTWNKPGLLFIKNHPYYYLPRPPPLGLAPPPPPPLGLAPPPPPPEGEGLNPPEEGLDGIL
jgi:hypothetical protein